MHAAVRPKSHLLSVRGAQIGSENVCGVLKCPAGLLLVLSWGAGGGAASRPRRPRIRGGRGPPARIS